MTDDTYKRLVMGNAMPEGIGEDVRLIIETPHGRLLDLPLIEAACIVRCTSGQILPFLYRPPLDPERPDEPRPLRRAVLTIVDDEPVTNVPADR